MAKGKAIKGVNLSLGEAAIKKTNNLSGRQAYKLAKTAIKQEGKTARMVESGKTKRTAARSGMGAASASSAISNADTYTDSRKEYTDKVGKYDGLAMGGIGTTDDAAQVMSQGSAEDGPGRTKVWN